MIAGCGGGSGKKAPTSTPSSGSSQSIAPTVQPAQSFSQPAQMGAVVWATALDPVTKQPTNTVESFSADASVIYAALKVQFLSSQAAVSATWTYNNTSLDALSTNAPAGAGLEDGWIEFHLTKSEGAWPDGTYAISVSLGGKIVQTAQVQVN
jgi:hypothetical protein